MAAVLEWRLTGGASNSDPNASLGGVMSANQLSGTAMNNLFDDVQADEAVSGDTEYRAVDLYNSGDAGAVSVSVWIHSQTSSPDTSVEIGHDATNNPHNAAASLETIANEGVAPTSPVISFSAPTPGSPIALPNIPAGQAVRLWIKRIVNAAAGNQANDTMTLRAQYA